MRDYLLSYGCNDIEVDTSLHVHTVHEKDTAKHYCAFIINSFPPLPQDEAKESRMRVAGLIDEVQNTHDRRSALYQSYDDAINKFKSSKDAAAFSASRKKIDADYKQLTQQIQNIQAQLKTEGADASEKVRTTLG